MIERTLALFDDPGPQNTNATLQAAADRAKTLGIRQVVLATNTGDTALKAARLFQDTKAKIVAVTLQAGRWKVFQAPDPDVVAQAKQLGVVFHTGIHAFRVNVDSAVTIAYGGLPASELIARVYYTFGQGVKVAIEVAIMAADAGLIDVDQELIAIGGTHRGADTALVLNPAYSHQFFNLNVAEVVAMPRRPEKRASRSQKQPASTKA
jgi:hypothetical protein